MADGTRTHDDRNHNPGLYQLSYGHHCWTAAPSSVPITQSAANYTKFPQALQTYSETLFAHHALRRVEIARFRKISALPRAQDGLGKGTGIRRLWHVSCDLPDDLHHPSREIAMLRYAAIFFVIALIAAIFGFTGIAAGAASIAKVLFLVFIVVAVVSLLVGLLKR